MRRKAKKVKVSVTLPKDLLKRLEDYRRAQPSIPSRSDGVANLLDKALKKEGFP